MKAEVWCKSTNTPKTIAPFTAWRGNLSCIPREGDWITLGEDYCSERVLDVHYDLMSDSVVIEIGPDFTGEYRKLADERGVSQ